jgi:hypothetical protein
VTHVRGGLTHIPWVAAVLLCALTRGAAWLTNPGMCSDAESCRHWRRTRSRTAAANAFANAAAHFPDAIPRFGRVGNS